MIRFHYDTLADAALLLLGKSPIHDQIELDNGVVISLGKSGAICCVEILDFSKHYDLKELEAHSNEGLPVTISCTRLMDEDYMERHYPRYCAAQRKIGRRPWDEIDARSVREVEPPSSLLSQTPAR